MEHRWIGADMASETILRPAAPPLLGSNQAGVRAHNERVVLSLIRRHGELAKADIARLSGLSSQTASVLIRGLSADGLVVAGEPRRGRVGQPSVPMRLNPSGAYAIGLKIGRRTSEMVLADFSGAVLTHRAILYPAPLRSEVLDFAMGTANELVRSLGSDRARLAGLGVGMPFDIGSWSERADEPSRGADWSGPAIAAALEDGTGLDVRMANDVTAACAAEQAFGRDPPGDCLYFFVGAFVGGGIVIDGRLVVGREGNAGALGSMPVPDGRGGVCQLIDEASIHGLETAVRAAGLDAVDLWRADSDWGHFGSLTETWIERAAKGLAHASVAALSVYDFEAVVIEGSFTTAVRRRLADAVRSALARADMRGLTPIRVTEGSIGRAAREAGAASLPFFARYFLDHRVLYAEADR